MNLIGRRQFIHRSATVLAGLPLLSSVVDLHRYEASRKWGIILNTVRHDMEADYQSTLQQLAEMGYQYIEGGAYGESPQAYLEYVTSLGLSPIIGGSSMGNLLDKEALEAQIKVSHQLGQQYVTCYWPWTSDAKKLTKDECLEAAERLNAIGKQFKSEGIHFTWHNHDKEFVTIEDRTAFDWLLQHTDPDWVNVQMDLYWVRKADHDPIALFQRYPGRTKLLHVKDMTATKKRDITCVGAGQIDFAAIFEHWEAAGVEYATVEHERTKEGEGIPCAQVSIDHLKQLG